MRWRYIISFAEGEKRNLQKKQRSIIAAEEERRDVGTVLGEIIDTTVGQQEGIAVRSGCHRRYCTERDNRYHHGRVITAATTVVLCRLFDDSFLFSRVVMYFFCLHAFLTLLQQWQNSTISIEAIKNLNYSYNWQQISLYSICLLITYYDWY